MNVLIPRFALAAPALAATLLLVACGGSEPTATTPTQVAAQVGAEEITIHQVNLVLQRTPGSGDPQVVSREVLERLIDQQLAVTAATNDKLHRSPDVVAQIEAARREVLARAYLQQITTGVTRPTPAEVQAYFDANPPLFTQRRLYQVQEIVVPKTPQTGDLAAALQGFTSSARSLEEAAAWLESRNIAFNQGTAVRAAEQILLEFLPRIHALRDGQTTLIDTDGGVTLIRVAASQSQPVTLEQARLSIEQFLITKRNNEAIANRLQALRASTVVTYMGEFAQPVAVPAAAPEPAAAPAANIERGVSGIR